MAIEKRGARWRARLRLNGYPELSKTFATRPAAERWHKQIEDANKDGTLTDVLAAESTFIELLRIYADKRTSRKRGADQELHRIRQLEASPLAHLKLSAITRPVMRSFRDRRLKTIKPSSWNRELSLIAQVLKFAAAERDAKIDVRSLLDGLRGQESPGRLGRIAPADEAACLLAADKVAPWVGPMIRLSLALGTRRTETWALTHADVDRKAMTIRIRGTKTKGSTRTLPISAGTLRVIDSIPRSLECDRILWQAGRVNELTYSFRRCAYHAKLPHLTLHLCRHEALSRLAEQGATVLTLMGFSGHRTLSMLSRYARPEAEGLRNIVAGMTASM